MNVPVIMYHSVCRGRRAPARARFMLAEHVLREQLRLIKRRTISIDTIIDGRATTDDVAITFDDGYADNLEIAAPLLRDAGMTATIFVVGDLARRRNWWDAASCTYQRRLLTPQQVRTLADSGFHIGSHGMSHRRLASLDDATIVRELVDSRRMLEDIIGRAVTTFAYPYGDVNARVKRLLRDAGYRGACAVNSGPLDSTRDPFEIRRVFVGAGTSRAYVALKLSGLEQQARVWLDVAFRSIAACRAIVGAR